MRITFLLLAGVAVFGQEAPKPDIANWPQFRGPNASGVASSSAAPPVEFGPSQPAAKQRLLWKQAIPPGHSSPSVWGERIFLTAFETQSQKLELICLSRKT